MCKGITERITVIEFNQERLFDVLFFIRFVFFLSLFIKFDLIINFVNLWDEFY